MQASSRKNSKLERDPWTSISTRQKLREVSQVPTKSKEIRSFLKFLEKYKVIAGKLL